MKYFTFFIFLISFYKPAFSQSPQLLKDINTNSSSIDFYDPTLLQYNGKAYFSADDGVNGTELWATDGTSQGTERVTDIWPGSGSSFPRSRVIYKNLIYFSAYDPVNGQELWATDGTAAGTYLVKDIFPGNNGNLPNGSGAGNFVVYQDKLIFSANDAAHGNELWISDGTDTGTVLLKDINPGTAFGYPSGFIEFNGILFFTAKDNTHGFELWKTDGTTNGTQLVKDVNQGLNDGISYPNWCIFNNKLFFNPNDGVHGFELWVTDGSDTGTQMLIDICPGNGSGYPTFFSVYNGAMYFPASDTTYGRELWKSDGTAAGTVIVKDIYPGIVGSFPSPMVNYKGNLYFKAADATSGTELWTSDGTAAGTHLASDVRPGTSPSFPQNLVVYGGQLYFIGIQNTDDGYQLLRYNDSTGITTQVTPDYFLANACADNDLDTRSVPSVVIGMLFCPATYDSLGTEFYTLQESLIGIDEPPEKINFSLFPVPAASSVSIDLAENQTATAIVFNALGDIVIAKQFNDKVMLDISSFAPGIFTVQVLTRDGKNTVMKFVKQ